MQRKPVVAAIAAVVLAVLGAVGLVPCAWAQEDELRVGLADFGSETFDPSMSASSNRLFLSPMWSTLIGSAPDGKLSKETGVARDWTVEHTATESIYTIELRPGVTFHNGAPVTAADVKFDIERLMAPTAASAHSSAFKTVASVDAPDADTVVIRTKAPYGFLLYDLSNAKGTEGYVYPKAYFEEVGAAGFNRAPIGAGPYRLVSHTPGTEIVYERFEDYWGSKPKYRGLRFVLVAEETTRGAGLKNGSIDIVAISRERLPEFKDFKIINKPGAVLTWCGFVPVMDGSPFADVRVRKALNLAINREEIRDYIYGGQAEITGGISYGTAAAGYKAIPPYPFDPEQAQALLHEAGADGLEVEVFQYARGGTPEMPRVAEAIAGYWQAVGVKTRITPLDYGTVRKQVASKKVDHPAMISWRVANAPFTQSIIYALYHSKGPLTGLWPAPAELDRMLDELNTVVDLDEFGEKKYRIAKFLTDNYLAIPLMEVGYVFAANPGRVAVWQPEVNADEMNWQGIR